MFKEILNLKMQLWLADLLGGLITLVAGIIIFSLYFGINKYSKNKKKKRQNNE